MLIGFESNTCVYFTLLFCQVWFKNRRVKFKKQLPPAANFRPLIAANQSTILPPSHYSLNEVQRENWPCSSADGFVSKTPRCSGMALPVNDGSWSRGQSSSTHTYHNSSPGSFEATALSYGSSGRQLSNYSNVLWIDTAQGPRASSTFNNQGERRAPNDPGAQQWDRRNGPRSNASWNQITKTSHSMALIGPSQASVHELEYTSLLDDVLAIIKLDLATQNNKADPSFLGNVPNMQ